MEKDAFPSPLERIAAALETLVAERAMPDAEAVADELINNFIAKAREQRFHDPWNYLTTVGRADAAKILREIAGRRRYS